MSVRAMVFGIPLFSPTPDPFSIVPFASGVTPLCAATVNEVPHINRHDASRTNPMETVLAANDDPFPTSAAAHHPASNCIRSFQRTTKPRMQSLCTPTSRGRRGYFTFTSIRIQGWMQHWNKCFPFDSPVISR